MKSKFLALALSSALMALAVMPTATADDGGTTGSAEVTTGGLSVSIQSGYSSGFTIPTVAWSASSQTKCYRETSNVTSTSAASFEVADLDATDAHYINVTATDFVGSNNANATMAVDGALYLSFEKVDDADCTDAATSDAVANAFVKVPSESHTSFSIASHVSPAAFDTDANDTSWIGLGNAATDVILGSGNQLYPGTYRFSTPSYKHTYPAGQVADAYSSTLTYASSTSAS